MTVVLNVVSLNGGQASEVVPLCKAEKMKSILQVTTTDKVRAYSHRCRCGFCHVLSVVFKIALMIANIFTFKRLFFSPSYC